MPLFKLVNASDEVIDTKVFVAQPPNPTGKSWRWLPVVIVGDDAFDPVTHKRTGPVTTIEETQVVDTYSIVLLDAQEISDAKVAAINSVNGLRSPILRAFYNVDKRLRVLEGAPAITFAQFKNGLPSVLP